MLMGRKESWISGVYIENSPRSCPTMISYIAPDGELISC